MKKLSIMLLAVLGLASMSLSQEIKMSETPESISVKALAVRGFDDDVAHRDRAGLGFELINFRNGQVAGNPTFATLDFWVLTNTNNARYPFFGAGLDIPVYRSKHLQLGLTGGWSANFSDFENIRDRQWSAGVSLTFKF